MISSVAKVVQPTATVSSVPVSGPSNYFETLLFEMSNSITATGIAQSVTPGQALRQTTIAPPIPIATTKVSKRLISSGLMK